MPGTSRLRAKFEAHPTYDVPRRIYDIESPATAGEPRQIADAFVARIAPQLKISNDPERLRFDKVNETLLGSHVLYQQYEEGVPISGAWLRVDIDKEGKVYNVQNDLVPSTQIAQAKEKRATVPITGAPAPAAKQVSAKEGAAKARAAAGGGNGLQVSDPERVYYPVAGEPVLSWKIVVHGGRPAVERKIYIDAHSGAILENFDMLKRVNGSGRVFDPNPVARLNNTSLEDNSVVPANAYIDVVLRDLANTGFLDGPFVTTRLTVQRAKKTNGKFLFKRNQRAFKEVMVYFHIDRVQRHLQSLGFNNVLNRAVEVNIDGTTDDNSFYSPATKALTFGTGGVDDAEDAEIILHEYGHAIQDDQVPGFGQTSEAKAMGEGFGDFLAASFFADAKPVRLRPTLGNWDAVAYSAADPPCLRRLDSNKLFPKDIVGEEHDDGEIWSACLWEIRGAVGRMAAEKLVIAHHFLVTRTAKFEDAANALITADKNLNHGANEHAIRDVFIRRGILPNPHKKNQRVGARFNDLVPFVAKLGRRVVGRRARA
jgi:hypothetical protein